jgi:anti-sigma factor RsiW
MRCAEVKRQIMDYIDGELSKPEEKEFTSHLASCPECKRLLESVRLSSIEPFRKAQRQKVPAEVWYQIKDTIAHKEKKAPSFSPLWQRWLDSFRIRKPALVPAMVTITVLMFIFIFGNMMLRQNPVNSYLAEQLQFMSELGENGQESYLGISDIDMGTSIERYFM